MIVSWSRCRFAYATSTHYLLLQ